MTNAEFSPSKVFAIYVDSEGREHSQPISDITYSGTLIDPYTGEDMEIVNVVVIDQAKILNQKSRKKQNPVVDEFGVQRWFNEAGELHREDGPAVIYGEHCSQFCLIGDIDRSEGVAYVHISEIDENARKECEEEGTDLFFGRGEAWFRNGKLHREDGPAFYVPGVVEEWHQNGELHREDGPAVTELISGAEFWFLNGLPHREDGPAVIYPNGTQEYWINGKQVDPF